jgi:hypothetical protein
VLHSWDIRHSCMRNLNVITCRCANGDPYNIFLVTRFPYSSASVWSYCMAEIQTKIFSFCAIFWHYKPQTEPTVEGGHVTLRLIAFQGPMEKCHIGHEHKTETKLRTSEMGHKLNYWNPVTMATTRNKLSAVTETLLYTSRCVPLYGNQYTSCCVPFYGNQYTSCKCQARN